ncbi:hypothetical protein SEA_OLICIOUS_6 [Streptomyces phage Olicious]|uniref:Uncharacterized protein n=7 Tax=Immanueltrevirus immanuel3 TaxID=2846399 RepID=A0A2H5BMN2_9CAUD|nr:hypothetical protein HWB41_gp06 [Streptomyces phage Immanuel3]AUG87333.1 hypothetical protein SEA_HAUGEANATOR_6 [Streptomyces phage HaugeAnator]AUG87397.1 hypothetical protein SEA_PERCASTROPHE_6 [Streptomyces phage Percastrophe]AUG87461.1 hypothetical protein SEA_ROMERO_6 [Streptomyces phage Romero]AUG87525.1 hypothetical protein SEA_TORITOKI_6 [Streptomyces phage ToriToki]AUG87589.1 hypothetical protein SEA_ZOOBEAR_6 [Streptomyces phage ZooBear]AZF95816.1 hypothetical protein SEA_OLICIOUS
MDEDEIEVVEIVPIKHTGWSLLVLGVSCLAGVTHVVAETLQSVSIMAAQHNLHKREEDEFYEVVKNG